MNNNFEIAVGTVSKTSKKFLSEVQQSEQSVFWQSNPPFSLVIINTVFVNKL